MIGSVIIEWKLGIYSFTKHNTNFPPFLHNCGELERATKQISHHAKKALNIICRRGSWVFNRYQTIGSLFPHPFSAFYCAVVVSRVKPLTLLIILQYINDNCSESCNENLAG